MIQQNPGASAVLDRIEQKVDLLLEGYEDLQARIAQCEDRQSISAKEFGYKLTLLFDGLHIIRDELRDKPSRDELNAAVTSVRK